MSISQCCIFLSCQVHRCQEIYIVDATVEISVAEGITQQKAWIIAARRRETMSHTNIGNIQMFKSLFLKIPHTGDTTLSIDADSRTNTNLNRLR